LVAGGSFESDPQRVNRRRVTFGIKTAPQHRATYADIIRVWLEADEIPEFEHAWLWDHMLPLGGDPWGRLSRTGPSWAPLQPRLGGCGSVTC
jgi:hypothetical protein